MRLQREQPHVTLRVKTRVGLRAWSGHWAAAVGGAALGACPAAGRPLEVPPIRARAVVAADLRTSGASGE